MRMVRYFSTSIVFACAVGIIEYNIALYFAPLAVLLNSQFLRPTVKGLIAFSTRLLSMGTSQSCGSQAPKKPLHLLLPEPVRIHDSG